VTAPSEAVDRDLELPSAMVADYGATAASPGAAADTKIDIQ